MPLLVHLADEREAGSIKRNGIKSGKHRNGIYCLPVLPQFYVSHQWLRELKRRNIRTVVGVYFKLPASQIVFAGKYNGAHKEQKLSDAIKEMKSLDDPLGYELIVPRKIKSSEIHKIKNLPQNAGWRYYPGSNGKRPCSCPYCCTGDIKGKRLREKNNEPEKRIGYHEILEVIRTSGNEDEILTYLCHLRSRRIKSDPKVLEFLLESESKYIIQYVAAALRAFRHKNSRLMLTRLLSHHEDIVRESAALSFLKLFGNEAVKILKTFEDRTIRGILAEWKLKNKRILLNRA